MRFRGSELYKRYFEIKPAAGHPQGDGPTIDGGLPGPTIRSYIVGPSPCGWPAAGDPEDRPYERCGYVRLAQPHAGTGELVCATRRTPAALSHVEPRRPDFGLGCYSPGVATRAGGDHRDMEAARRPSGSATYCRGL